MPEGFVQLVGGKLVFIQDGALIDVSTILGKAGRVLIQAEHTVIQGAISGGAGGMCRGSGRCASVHTGVVSSDRMSEVTNVGIQILGAKITLDGSGIIDSSGLFNSNTVLVGGDFGGRSGVHHATTTTIAENCVISADSLLLGEGGKIATWATGLLRMNGQLLARGGMLWGNGGYVEVSGKGELEFKGSTDERCAGNGRNGELIIDPENIYIDTVPVHDSYLPTILSATQSGTFLLSNTGIVAKLAVGNVFLSAVTNIRIYAPLDDSGYAAHNNTLTLDAGNSITLNVGDTVPGIFDHLGLLGLSLSLSIGTLCKVFPSRMCWP